VEKHEESVMSDHANFPCELANLIADKGDPDEGNVQSGVADEIG
jgi:hypothetical protein